MHCINMQLDDIFTATSQHQLVESCFVGVNFAGSVYTTVKTLETLEGFFKMQ